MARNLLDDRELIVRCQAGDVEAKQMLFVRYSKRVYAMTLRLTGSVADAEDVVQDTFLRAFRYLDSFRGDSAVATWLCRIAINLSRDVYQKQTRYRPGDGGSSADLLPSKGEPTDSLVRKRLEVALNLLPQGYREVLVMHDVMEMEHQEIAEILGVAVGTSKSQLHKARARMRELLTTAGSAA